MKIPKILTLILVLSLVGGLVAGCSKKVATTTTTTQEVTVGKGTITVSITSTGSMDYADYENLSFGADGTVGAVNVKVGDLVKKGQVLATLDADTWNDQLDTLTKAVQTAQRNLTTAKSNLAKAQRAVVTAQLGVSQAELDVQTAQNTLNNISDVKTAQDAVDQAQANIDAAQAALAAAQAQGDINAITGLHKYINGDPAIPGSTGLKGILAQTKKNLQEVLKGTAITLTNNVALQIASAQLQIIQKQNALVGAQAAVDDANTAVANAQMDVANAEQTVKDAQTNLDTAKAAVIQITAPFDGAITTVNVQAGVGLSVASAGVIKKGATAMVIADTSKFEANMLVNETDITKISIGTLATVTATALPNVTLNARVTDIAPVATIQSGVVNYAVTAIILGIAPTTTTTTIIRSGQSGTTTATTTPSTSGRQRATTTQSTTPSTSGQPEAPGTLPTALPSGIPGQTGNLTPEQIAQLQQRFQQAQAAREQANAAATSQLRQGLSLTVNLIVQQKVNVVAAPNQAVKTVSGKNYVQIKTSSGTTEQREVTIGLKDYQNTEIVNGLIEGEVILITKTSTLATTTTTRAPNVGIGGGLLR